MEWWSEYSEGKWFLATILYPVKLSKRYASKISSNRGLRKLFTMYTLRHNYMICLSYKKEIKKEEEWDRRISGDESGRWWKIPKHDSSQAQKAGSNQSVHYEALCKYHYRSYSIKKLNLCLAIRNCSKTISWQGSQRCKKLKSKSCLNLNHGWNIENNAFWKNKRSPRGSAFSDGWTELKLWIYVWTLGTHYCGRQGFSLTF